MSSVARPCAASAAHNTTHDAAATTSEPTPHTKRRVMRSSSPMRTALIVTGGVDASARDRVVPALLWLIERLARRPAVHGFALHYHRPPRACPLLGAMVHDLGRVDWPPGLRRARVTARLRRGVAAHG